MPISKTYSDEQKQREEQIIKYLAKTTPDMTPLLILTKVKVDKTPQEYQAILKLLSSIIEDGADSTILTAILIKAVEALESMQK